MPKRPGLSVRGWGVAAAALVGLPLALAPWASAQPSLAPSPPASPTAGAVAVPLPAGPAPLQAMAEPAFLAVLKTGDLVDLELACRDAVRFDLTVRLRSLRDRLLVVRPAPQSLPVVMANANALLSCKAPETALTVLDRYGPGPGAERDEWLILQWRAASAALNHRRASEALTRLAAGNLARLETVALPLLLREDGTLATRPALDALADHLRVLGENEQAARVLLSGRMTGQPAAERVGRAVALLAGLPLADRNLLMESALDQAAAAGAWGLASELLEQQRLLLKEGGGDPRRAESRRLRLTRRIDDAYAEWRLRAQKDSMAPRTQQLERQLRSPRQSGGHAAPTP